MTKPPKWWSANGPPSPTTPMSQLDMQVQHDRQTSKQIRNNRYYELDNEDDSFMFKYKLSDGTFVFTTHSSVKKLRQVLKTTKQISLSKDVNNSCANQNILNNSPQKNSIYSLIERAKIKKKVILSPNNIGTNDSVTNNSVADNSAFSPTENPSKIFSPLSM